jgi:hypothetical protein
MDLASFYYGLVRPTAYGTAAKLRAAVRGHTKNRHAIKQEASTPPPTKTTSTEIRDWLHEQDAYTMHRKVRKRSPRNPHTVNNVLDVSECDLVDVQNPANLTIHTGTYFRLLM